MKKILYLVTQSELGGVQRYIYDLATNLGDEFEVSVAFGEQGEKGELAKKLKQAGIKYHVIKNLKRSISPINDIKALFEIRKLIKTLKPDIVHLNSSKISILGSIAKLLITRYPLLVTYTVHGWVFNEPLPQWKKSFYKYAEKFTARFKNKIICISKLDYEIAKNDLKIPEKKLALIYHGIKNINFLSRDEAREKLYSISNSPSPSEGEGRGEVLIGSIGNLYKTKGYEYLIEATRLLVDAGLDVKTIIIGEGSERKNLEDLIGQLNLKSRVLLTGRIDNASELLKVFDVFACSSVKEGFPYAILEAMQAGLPIVSTNVGGIKDMIENNVDGLLVEPKNPHKLAEKIKSIITGKWNYQINKKIKFSLEKMIEETKKIYL
ncbi:MAG: glycosyltransferase family 4 protein [Candidatus Falkowbacteria bacterium]